MAIWPITITEIIGYEKYFYLDFENRDRHSFFGGGFNCMRHNHGGHRHMKILIIGQIQDCKYFVRVIDWHRVIFKMVGLKENATQFTRELSDEYLPKLQAKSKLELYVSA